MGYRHRVHKNHL